MTGSSTTPPRYKLLQFTSELLNVFQIESTSDEFDEARHSMMFYRDDFDYPFAIQVAKLINDMVDFPYSVEVDTSTSSFIFLKKE